MTKKDIQKATNKNHIKRLMRELLEETSEFSKFEGHKTYRLTGVQTPEQFLDSITISKETIEKAHKLGTHQLVLHFKYPYIERYRKNWEQDIKITFKLNENGEIVGKFFYVGGVCPNNFDNNPESLDNVIKHHILDSDHFVSNGTAISIYF